MRINFKQKTVSELGKMKSNVVGLVVILITESYSKSFSHGQSHNHAYSSQSITMHQNHQEPIYFEQSHPYNDKFEENDHSIPDLSDHRHLYNGYIQNEHQNHHFPDHRHLFNEQTENYYQNHQEPDHRNLYSGQPIVVDSGFKEMPFKDNQDHQHKSYKHKKMPFHIKPQKMPLYITQDVPIKSHYKMPLNHFENHEIKEHHLHRTPVRIDSHKNRHRNVNHIPHREYEFNYNIEDKLTGDHKAHHETRNDGVVKGVYSFQEADGSIRIVEYTADAKNGFHAKVRHEGQKHKVPKHHKNYSHRPRYHPQHNNLHPLLFNSPKY